MQMKDAIQVYLYLHHGLETFTLENVMIHFNELPALNSPAISKPHHIFAINDIEMSIKHLIPEWINIIQVGSI